MTQQFKDACLQGSYNRKFILPNAAGTKYVIGPVGPNCTGLRPNEINILVPWMSTEGTIYVDEDGVYRLEGRGRNKVNDILIKMENNIPLNFGDRITIGKDIFMFNEREYKKVVKDKTETEGNGDSDNGDMQSYSEEFFLQDNSLVLANIMDYLPVKDLLNARFVSKAWNEEAVKVVRKKAMIKIDCSNKDEHLLLFRYVEDMRDFRPRNVHFIVPTIKVVSWKEWAIFFRDFNLFLESLDLDRSIINLRLEGKMLPEVWSQILAKVGPNLVKLFIVDPIMDSRTRLTTFPVSLPRLQRFGFAPSTAFGIQNKKYRSFYQSLMETLASSSIQEIGLEGSYKTFMLKDIFVNRTWAHLNSIKMMVYIKWHDLKKFSQLGNLKNLELKEIRIEGPQVDRKNRDLLQNVLNKNANTLEQVTLALTFKRGIFGWDPLSCEFVQFTRLRSFCLVYAIPRRFQEGCGYIQGRYGVVYKDAFPVLENLRLDFGCFKQSMGNMNYGLKMFKTFCPVENEQVCETLNVFDVCLDQVDAGVKDKMRQMFPNVHENWFNGEYTTKRVVVEEPTPAPEEYLRFYHSSSESGESSFFRCGRHCCHDDSDSFSDSSDNW